MDRRNQHSYPGKLTRSSAHDIIQKTAYLTGGQQKFLPQNFNFAWKDGADYGPFVQALINADNTFDAPVTNFATDLKWAARKQAVVGFANEKDDKDFKYDPSSAKFARLPGSETSNEQVGIAKVPEEYWDYVKEKENQDLYNNYISFIVSNMDESTPVKRKYWREKYPELMEQRDKNLLFQQFIQTKAYLIQRNGIQNEEDAYILYMKEHNFDLNSKWIPGNIEADFNRFYGGFVFGTSDQETRDSYVDIRRKEPDYEDLYTGTEGVTSNDPSFGNGIEVHQNDAKRKWVDDRTTKDKPVL